MRGLNTIAGGKRCVLFSPLVVFKDCSDSCGFFVSSNTGLEGLQLFSLALKDMEVRKRRGERCGSLICSMSLPCITSFFLLFLAFIGEGTVNVSALNYTSTRLITSFRLARIQSFLEKINKPAVRSIEVRMMVISYREIITRFFLLVNHNFQA